MNKLFDIFELSGEKAEKYIENPDKPHRHTYEEIIVAFEGTFEHYIDFKREVISAPAIVYVAMGKMHQVLPSKDIKMWGLRYKNEFASESALHFYAKFLENPHFKFKTVQCMERLLQLCDMMYYEYAQESPDLNIIRHLLNAFLAMISSESRRSNSNEVQINKSQVSAFNNFLKILENNFRRAEGVQFYAEKMNTSARNLNIICDSVFGKSVSEIIETRKLIEAKQMLMYSDKSVSEIGFELGYNEKSYFTRVFTKKTGFTPTEFKAKAEVV